MTLVKLTINTYSSQIYKYTFLCVFMFTCLCMQAQSRLDTIAYHLNQLAGDFPGLNQSVELSVSDVSLGDFLNALANANKINLSVDEAFNVSITNNFTDVSVSDVLLFLCKKYDLDITVVGSIITVKKYKAPPPPVIKPEPKQIIIKYNKATDLLSFDLKYDTLYQVAKELTKVTGLNVVVSKDIENNIVNGFIQDQNFAGSIDMLARTNNLKVSLTPGGFYFIERLDNSSSGSRQSGNQVYKKGGNGIQISNTNLITYDANNLPIQDIVISVSEKLKLDYYLFSDLKGNATLSVSQSSYEDLLKNLFNGTEYTYKKENGVYLIGDRSMEGLRAAKVLSFKYRTVDKIVDFIPSELKKGIEIKTFNDLNSLIISGSQPRIDELEKFTVQLDRVVPVVSIEVMVIQINNTSNVAKGLTAGLSDKPVTTSGTLFPGVDMTIGSSGVNDILSLISGTGILGNTVLGKVMPNFYVQLQLLETNGSLKVRSTPKLATLNGHEASLSIGSTQYYLETQNTVVGTQNPQNITTQQYKPVNADLSLTINPFVSGDEQITLDIKVKQSDFTARIAPTAPPGKTSRDFESMIRVKNEETILLGGLEESNINDTGSGFPGLSRVPVLKWLFSNRNKSRSKTKLMLLIKPTVLY